MAASGSFIPTSLAHTDNLGEGHPREAPLHWRRTKFNLYDPERRDQESTDFIYDLLKLHKQLELGISQEDLVDHIFIRLEPQIQDYVDVRNPQNTVQLLEMLSRFEERYSWKTMRGSRNSDNVERRG
ncbi:uncharacterized protein TNCV_2906261 [Trichonephila clavipes]|nr:uncharacterized protein TNCV_2906261 [Trichonephila clavipes]